MSHGLPFTSLLDRIDGLPLLLAGPIVRRVEPDRVTVWFAARMPVSATLEVRTRDGQVCLSGRARTVTLGEHVHIAAVTAALPHGAEPLERGRMYGYDMFFHGAEQGPSVGPRVGSLVGPRPSDFQGAGLLAPHVVCHDPTESRSLLLYEPEVWPVPTFVVPPAAVESLRMVQGSCRLPHRGGGDAMPALDDILAASHGDLEQRPQLFFITGDAIYADGRGLPRAWAELVVHTGRWLLGWSEFVPGLERHLDTVSLAERKRVHGMHTGVPEVSEFQLFGLGEYLAMYLLVCADVLWPDDIADEPKNAHIRGFRAGLGKVRRALANISMLATIDDHEVVDDWNLTLDWCQRVYARPMGRRMVQNALSAFALFTAWGNTPEQFAAPRPERDQGGRSGPVTPGRALLRALETWRPVDAEESAPPNDGPLLRLLGIPTSEDDFFFERGPPRIAPGDDAISWHFQLLAPGYDILAIDGRTRRGFPGTDPLDLPDILSEEAIAEQIPRAVDRPTVVVASIPILGVRETRTIRFIRHAVAMVLGLGAYLRHRMPLRAYQLYALDLGDYWSCSSRSYHAILARLAPRGRVVFLSGDVHMSFAARMEYRGSERAIFAQLTSSGMCREGFEQRSFHRGGYNTPWPASDEPPSVQGCLQAVDESDAAGYTIDYLCDTGRGDSEGREIVGRNNISEVRFERTERGLTVSQRVYWRLVENRAPAPHTEFTVVLGS